DLGRDVVATAANDNTRPAEIKDVKKLIAQKRVEQEKALGDALAKLSIDWSAPPANQSGQAKLDVSITSTAGDKLAAGQLVTLTGTVTNNGNAPAWRVQSRIHADDPYFDDYELVFGKINPGETKTFTQRVQLPKDAVDRVDQLTVDVKEA